MRRFTFTHALAEHALYEDLGALAGRDCTSGSRKPSKSGWGTRPVSGSVSSRAIGCQRS